MSSAAGLRASARPCSMHARRQREIDRRVEDLNNKLTRAERRSAHAGYRSSERLDRDARHVPAELSRNLPPGIRSMRRASPRRARTARPSWKSSAAPKSSRRRRKAGTMWRSLCRRRAPWMRTAAPDLQRRWPLSAPTRACSKTISIERCLLAITTKPRSHSGKALRRPASIWGSSRRCRNRRRSRSPASGALSYCGPCYRR